MLSEVSPAILDEMVALIEREVLCEQPRIS